MIDIAAWYALLTFPPFLLLRKGIPVTEFGFALTLLFAGGAAGRFVCGIFAEWWEFLPLVAATEILTASGILTLTVIPPFWIWVVFPILGIVLNGTSSVLYATVAKMIPPASHSRGYGMITALLLLLTLSLLHFISPKVR